MAAAITICSDFGAQKNKVWHCFHCFPIYLPRSKIFECWVSRQLFHSFTFIKRLVSSSSLSAIRVLSSANLRLLIFLPAILILAPASSSQAFCMMYSAYKSAISRVTIYSLDVLLSQFGTSPLFHVQFYLWLLDLHTDFSGGRSGGLVFPSLEEFSSLLWFTQSKALA